MNLEEMKMLVADLVIANRGLVKQLAAALAKVKELEAEVERTSTTEPIGVPPTD